MTHWNCPLLVYPIGRDLWDVRLCWFITCKHKYIKCFANYTNSPTNKIEYDNMCRKITLPSLPQTMIDNRWPGGPTTGCIDGKMPGSVSPVPSSTTWLTHTYIYIYNIHQQTNNRGYNWGPSIYIYISISSFHINIPIINP